MTSLTNVKVFIYCIYAQNIKMMKSCCHTNSMKLPITDLDRWSWGRRRVSDSVLQDLFAANIEPNDLNVD